MAINSFGDLIFEIISLSPYELERANLIHHSERGAQPPHGYICPYCDSGNRDNRTGALDFDYKNDRWVHTCRVCNNGGDNATLFQFLFNANFKDALVAAADRFGIHIDDIDWGKEQKKVAKANKIFKPSVVHKKPIWPTRFTPPEQVPLIKKDIADAQKNLDNIPRDGNDRFAGGNFRGLKIDTLRHFGCGFLDKWAHPKNRLQGAQPFADPRVIIPTPDGEHYLALRPPLNRTGDKDKMHAGVMRIFNPDALKEETVFLVEGEIDCMSVWQCSGGKIPCAAVISTGGGKANLIPMIDAGVVTFRKFIILFDKDAGEKAAYELKAELDKRQFPAAVRFLFDFLSPDDQKKFGNKIDPNQYLCQKSGVDLQLVLTKIRDDADKEFGDVEAQVTINFDSNAPTPAQVPAPVAEQNQLAVTELKPATDSPTADKFAPLFDGLKPIRISPGAILYVANPDVKPALEILFVDKNFKAFTDYLNGNFSRYSNASSDTENALFWIVDKLYPFFSSDVNRLNSFISSLPAIKNSELATFLLRDDSLFVRALNNALLLFDGDSFSFDDQFRRKLIAFAKHSDNVFQSILRFNYRLVVNFLDNSFTDLICAELLVFVQRDFLRFASDQDTWYVWQINHWHAVNSNSLANLYSLWTPLARKTRVFAEFDLFKKTCDLIDFDITHKDELSSKKNPAIAEKRKRLDAAVKAANNKLRETNALESTRSITNFFALASGLPEILISTDDLDQNPLLFNCANCTINLDTMETYSARQSDLITMVSSTVFNPDVKSDVWDKFLNSAIPDLSLRDWLQRFFGYSLSGLTDEDVFAFINGIGGSGKTTFISAISRALGDYAKTFDVNLITINSKQKDGNEPNPALAALRACRLACSSETEKNRRLDEAKIKLFTGGSKITARELHKPIFEFTPKFKMVIDGNYLLRISDVNDRGLQRRLRIIPFDHTPNDNEVDIHLEDKLSTPEARSAILNWCLDGWRLYRQRGLRDIPDEVKKVIKSFYDSNNTIANFLADYDYETGDKDDRRFRCSVKKVWDAYKIWQRQTPRAPFMSRSEFIDNVCKTLEADNVFVKPIKKVDFFIGFRIDENTDNIEQDFIPPFDD